MILIKSFITQDHQIASCTSCTYIHITVRLVFKRWVYCIKHIYGGFEPDTKDRLTNVSYPQKQKNKNKKSFKV